MATFANAISATTTTDNAALTTGAFTPSANDLLLAVAVVTGQANGGTFSDSQGLGWTQVQATVQNGSADSLVMAVANNLTANSSMTVTFTPAGAPTSTGIAMSVVRIGGMSRTGASAIRQSGKQDNGAAAGTPTVTWGSTSLSANLCYAAVGNGSNPPSITQPSGWFGNNNTGYTTPTTGIEDFRINSNFTNSTVTWGGTSATAFSAIAAELDTSAAVVLTYCIGNVLGRLEDGVGK